MRLRVPLIPVSIQFEPRSLGPFRPRFSMRTHLAVVALLPVALAGYVTLVEFPARRLRFRNADRAVGLQINLLRGAAAHERQRERAEKERGEKCRGSAGDEERRAARWPEPSKERASHLAAAELWAKAADEAMIGAERAAGKARKYQGDADALLARRSQLGDDPAALEQMAPAANTFLATPASDESFPLELAPARLAARVEHNARTMGRSTFPTIVGQRASAIEATAIWRAEQFLKRTQPGVVLKRCKVDARQLTPDQPFWWEVKFIDLETKQSYRVRPSFSEPTIKEYLAKNP